MKKIVVLLLAMVTCLNLQSQIGSSINPYLRPEKIISDSENTSQNNRKKITKINKEINKNQNNKTVLFHLTEELKTVVEQSVEYNDEILEKISTIESPLSSISEERKKLSEERKLLSKENNILRELLKSLNQKIQKDTLTVEEVSFPVEVAVEQIKHLRRFERTPHNLGIDFGNSYSSYYVNAEYMYRRKSKGNLGFIAHIGLDNDEAIFFGLGAKFFVYPSNNNFDPFLKLLATRNIKMLHDGIHYDMLYEATVGTQYAVSRKFMLNGSFGFNIGFAEGFTDNFLIGRFGVMINIFSPD